MDECVPDRKLIFKMRELTCLPTLDCRDWLIKTNNNLEEAIKAAREYYFEERTGKPW